MVEAIAAHLATLEEHGARAQLRGARRHREARRSGAHDADVAVDPLAHRSAARRSRRHAAGARESSARPRIGIRIGGLKMTPRLGFPPWSRILPRPPPTAA